jgi:hypothetical protein
VLVFACLGGFVLAIIPTLVGLKDLVLAPPLRLAKETTYIVEPLKSDGRQVDYFAAIQEITCPPNIATDENGFRLIVRHLGKSPDSEPEHFAGICRELGLDLGAIQPDMSYQEPFDALKAYIESDAFDRSLLEGLPPDERSTDDVASMLYGKLAWPWTLDDLPMMARWLDDSGPALDLIGVAVRRPTFHVPLVRTCEDEALMLMPLSELLSVRDFARGLSARANHRLALGDLDGAIEDIVTCKLLGRRIAGSAMSIGMLVGIGFETVGSAIGIAGSLEHPPTREHFQRLVDEMEALPTGGDLDRAMLIERFVALDSLQLMANGRTPDDAMDVDVPPPARRLAVRGLDWNVIAEQFNSDFDALLATGEMPPRAEFGLWDAVSSFSVRGRSKHIANVFSALLLPSMDAFQEAIRRNACTSRMKRIVLAMLMYEQDHAALPPAFSVAPDGNPLHSWRVLLLPYLNQEALYGKIRLDEPWDSEHNRQFHGEAVAFYRCPSDPAAAPGQTTYSVVVGPGMPFEAGEGKRLADFGPDSDDMILLVERAEPAGWMDPTHEVRQAAAEEGIGERAKPFAPVPPNPNGIGSHHPGRANFAFRNGAVRCLHADIEPEVLGKLLRGTNTDKNIYD